MARSQAVIAAESAAPAGLRWLVGLVLLGLTACGGEVTTPGEALRLFDTNLPDAFVGERYSEPVRAVGGLRPYAFRLESGTLPPGLSLLNGTLEGVPDTTGSYTFTVAVSDASLSSTFREYRLRVVERPPPTVRFNAPATEVRGTVTLRLEVEQAFALRGVRTVVRWDPTRFELEPDSPTAERGDVALLADPREGELQLDLAVLGATLDGDPRLASFTLRAREPSTLLLTGETELRWGEDRRDLQPVREGRAAAEPVPAAPAAPAPATEPAPTEPSTPNEPQDGQNGTQRSSS